MLIIITQNKKSCIVFSVLKVSGELSDFEIENQFMKLQISLIYTLTYEKKNYTLSPTLKINYLLMYAWFHPYSILYFEFNLK